MPVLYARVSDETLAYIKRQHEESGLPMARVVEALLTEAYSRNWAVRRPRITTDHLPQVVEPR